VKTEASILDQQERNRNATGHTRSVISGRGVPRKKSFRNLPPFAPQIALVTEIQNQLRAESGTLSTTLNAPLVARWSIWA
jgi:hypothetical protein